MEEYCPLCIKRGLKKKMKAIQINLEEAVWMCESEECTWPMDHKELEFIPRKIGESWSCYWNTYKPQKSPVTVPQTGWDFFTPPYTPRTEVSPTASSETSTHSTMSVNSKESNHSSKESSICSSKELTNVSSKETNLSCNELSLSPKELNLPPKELNLSPKKLNLPPKELNLSSKESANTTNDQNLNPVENEIKIEDDICTLSPTKSELLTDITNPSVSNPFSLDQLSSCKSENSDSENAQNTLTSDLKTINTGVPTIVNIEKMNLVSVRGINGSKQLPKDIKEKLIPTPKKVVLIKNRQENVVEIEDKPKFEIKTVNIEGIPPVTLKYEIPTFLTKVDNSVEKTCEVEIIKDPKVDNQKPIKTETQKIQILSKKNLMASKMFQKFDFSELRKLKNAKKIDVEEINIDVSEETSSEIKEIPVVETTSTSNQNSSSNVQLPQTNIDFDKFDKNFSPLSEDSKDNVISDLDSFLNDFLEENKININETVVPNLPEDDDWISSLLT